MNLLLRIAWICLVTALGSALFGFDLIGLTLEPARMIFLAAITLAVILFILNFIRNPPPSTSA
jgi:hypothetical protein